MKKPLYGDWNTTLRRECLQAGEKIDRETLFHFMENSKTHAPGLIQIDEVADIAGGVPIYDTIYKKHTYAPWIYGGQCEVNKRINRNPALMPMVYICSQYRADTEIELLQHIEVAKMGLPGHRHVWDDPNRSTLILPEIYGRQQVNGALLRDGGWKAARRIMRHILCGHGKWRDQRGNAGRDRIHDRDTWHGRLNVQPYPGGSAGHHER